LKENFDRFNSKFTRRRKEMVNFRRVVTVLAVLALFTGLAFAQQENCSAQATNSTPLRAEGYTEQTGDIIINCVSGQALALGANIPLVNITVFYSATVTSRLLGSAGPSGQTPSEALLLIDEPTAGNAANIGVNPGQSSYGSTLALIPCTTPFTGCAQTAGPTVSGFATALVGTSPAPNVYQGVTTGNSVTFYGVPVLPPSTIGARVYRITNVRVNATQGGPAAGTTPVQSFITVSGSAALPISNSQPIVGYIQNGLTASVGGAGSFNQCVSQSKQSSGTLKFQELFGTAFKTRVFAQTNTAGAGQLGVLPQSPAPFNQSTPGGIYNSESNFVYGGAFTSSGYTPGLADFGTRLKATFNNVPSGVTVYVSSANIGANAAAMATPGGNLGNVTPATGTYVGLAQLVNGESTSDGAGTLPAVNTDATGTVLAPVTVVAGTGTAVWEVVNTNPNTAESFTFNVFLSYTAATSTNTPLPGTTTVTLSYAPTATSGVASSTLPIPRFSTGTTPFSGNVFSINKCRTILLYPYVTNQAGFDTGLTVANTSSDPFGTGLQAGSCTLNFYGGTTTAPTTPPAPLVIPGGGLPIAAGTVWANTLGTIAPTFQGYIFAVCDFQFAHGFAFISDVGARNLAMGYLALIIPDMGTGVRQATPSCQGLGAQCAATGEEESH
jgi:hypothetical protein